jgi:hypothetical protein
MCHFISFSDVAYFQLYTRETFSSGLASQLNILPSPRALFEGTSQAHASSTKTLAGVMVMFLTSSATLLLADARACPYLPVNLKVSSNSMMKQIAGPEGGNCLGACSNLGFRCDQSSFDFVNSCKSLSAFFPCENGCDYNVRICISNSHNHSQNVSGGT